MKHALKREVHLLWKKKVGRGKKDKTNQNLKDPQESKEESSVLDFDQTKGSIWKDVITYLKAKGKKAALQNRQQTPLLDQPWKDKTLLLSGKRKQEYQ